MTPEIVAILTIGVTLGSGQLATRQRNGCSTATFRRRILRATPDPPQDGNSCKLLRSG